MKQKLLCLLLVTFQAAVCQVSIVADLDAQQLLQDNLIGNPNFPATNFSMVNGNQFGGPNSVGMFLNTATDLPFEEGIVLSTGNIAQIPGPNTSLISTAGNAWLGDPELSAITASPNLNNASSLKFDFVAEVPAISFDFMMASEEYDGSSECLWADIFAFIITNNTTGTSENLAVVPGTTMPITTTTVHGLTNQCGASNEDYFHRYNHTNASPNVTADQSPINMNGQTTVFVLIGDLVLGDNYTVKIVIADEGDSVWDSALFVRNSSFGAYPVVDQEPNDLIIEDTDDNGVEVFDLTTNEALMLGAIDTAVYTFDFYYYETLADAEANMNPIANPQAYTNTSEIQDIYLRMQNSYTGTGITTQFRITIDGNLLAVNEFDSSIATLYPNPVADVLHIEGNTSNITQIDVYTINGQLLSSQKHHNVSSTTLDFSVYASGTYLVKVMTDTGSIYKRIMK